MYRDNGGWCCIRCNRKVGGNYYFIEVTSTTEETGKE